jgi:2-octaprenyl-6-methoxyphenol hydroxylase
MLGAVLSYGALVAPLQAAFLAACVPSSPGASGLHARFATAVEKVEATTDGTGVTISPHGADAEVFDLAVIAEGGVFAEQARKSLTHDYGQTAWVGTVTLEGAAPGLAVERFTRDGPLALLPLPGAAGGADDARTSRAALVWCVESGDDPVAPLTDAQRIAVLSHRLPEVAGRIVDIGPLKSFALGLNVEGSLVHGRIARIGNAAQTLHPVAGQGLNLGLRDAFVLVDRLARFAGASDGGVTQALRGLEFRRAPDRWSIIGTTDFLARTFTWHAPGLAAARGLGLAALQAVPPLKRALARQMMFGWR